YEAVGLRSCCCHERSRTIAISGTDDNGKSCSARDLRFHCKARGAEHHGQWLHAELPLSFLEAEPIQSGERSTWLRKVLHICALCDILVPARIFGTTDRNPNTGPLIAAWLGLAAASPAAENLYSWKRRLATDKATRWRCRRPLEVGFRDPAADQMP